MKKLTLTLCALTALVSAAYAGTETYSSSKNMVQTPCPSWYADNEWNIGISGIYGHTVDSTDNFDSFFGDDAWGVAGDVKYFFHRYFGLGVQGFGLWSNDNDVTINGVRFEGDSGAIGGVLGTFTLRYPIPCTRWSPYLWWGVGGLWGGGDRTAFVPGVGSFRINGDDSARLMGQYGAGVEVRITPHIGWTFDGSYNQVEYSHNDFWMVRTGINFAF